MSLAKKCDRCGKLYEIYKVKGSNKDFNGVATIEILNNRNYQGKDILDLCSECRDSLDEWLHLPGIIKKDGD